MCSEAETRSLPFVNSRNCSDRVVMLEASVDTYKRKLENLGDLKRQMKLLEENNMIYMQNTVSLEEELRKANAARAQLETYKRLVDPSRGRGRLSPVVFVNVCCPFLLQVQELHRKLSDETRRADNLAFEMKKLEEKHETVLKEKEVWPLFESGGMTRPHNTLDKLPSPPRGSSSRETL